MVLQRDFALLRRDGSYHKFEYILVFQGEPVQTKGSDTAFDFGLVNISSEAIHLEMYKNSDSVPSMDLEDKNTLIVTVTFND
jgi:hypothetical protein